MILPKRLQKLFGGFQIGVVIRGVFQEPFLVVLGGFFHGEFRDHIGIPLQPFLDHPTAFPVNLTTTPGLGIPFFLDSTLKPPIKWLHLFQLFALDVKPEILDHITLAEIHDVGRPAAANPFLTVDQKHGDNRQVVPRFN